MLQISDLNVYYGESHILRNVDLHVPARKMVCLIGRNGVGKTTLLKTIIGLIKPRTGTITFAEQSIVGKSPDKRARLGIGYVPQGREIIPRLTVKENLLLGLEARREQKRTQNQEIPEEIFTLFPVLKSMLGRRGGDLSGGQQQQLAIARALVTKPRLILLDEPTEGIQPSIIKDIGRAIAYLRQKGGLAIVLVEQYFEFARDLADRFVLMERGEVIVAGDRQALEGEDVRNRMAI